MIRATLFAVTLMAALSLNACQETRKPGDLRNVPTDVRLSTLNDANLQNFLSNEDSVALLTACFVKPKECKSAHAINLIKQVRKLGHRGSCSDCTPAEQESLNDNIYNFIQGYQTRYPRYWRQVLPQIGHIISGS